MNERFIEKWKASELSISELSRKTGLAYSLIYDIAHQKKDINKRTAADVMRIAAVLGTASDQIMNPFCIVDGFQGKHNGITYSVQANPDIIVRYEHDGIQESLLIGHTYHLPQRFSHYICFIEMAIDRHIEQKELEQYLKENYYARKKQRSGIHSDAQKH